VGGFYYQGCSMMAGKYTPNITRMIIEYKVTDQGDDFHIAIASTLDKKGGQK
jgi:hypothetical protein